MADDNQFSSRSESKRKYDDQGASPEDAVTPPFTRRATGFSAPIVSPSSCSPPLDGFQLAKQRAQEIAARLLSDAEAKRPRVENGDNGEDAGERGFGSSANDHQISSAAIRSKIQVTRDADADPYSQTRTVELTGTAEQVNKAEQLVNDVLQEAEVGSSGAAGGRKFAGVQAGSEQFIMKVPNNKVGLVIGKGGESIKNMQAKSGARIQVCHWFCPSGNTIASAPGDNSAERTVQIDGTKEQIESAKQLVYEVIKIRLLGRISSARLPPPSSTSSHGLGGGPPGPPPMQQSGYGYMQPGAYAGPPTQYNNASSQPAYPGYPPPPAAGGYSGYWDQTSSAAGQQTTPSAGYDYYNQQQQPPPPASSPQASNYGAQASYNSSSYSHPQAQGYSQDGGYSDGYSAPPAAAAAQAGGYTQQQPNGYDQHQSYGYGAASHDGSAAPAPAGYGHNTPQTQAPFQPGYPPPPPAQSGYQQQAPAQSEQSYGGGAPQAHYQQPYGGGGGGGGGAYPQPQSEAGGSGHGSYDAAPAVPGGATKAAAPQS
ncbi:unnamed protein product [Spirodela intermedia]|uniref:K Homology domain-containing protein n=1 Tax=Spirodela intermedia TaxID=51605 RepID=A0A7I8JRS0_SPIIN|nr:unnamed protein product [Spirodela intermedia]CAA6672824.1 unnamed protein product [Spirodela intermedia]